MKFVKIMFHRYLSVHGWGVSVRRGSLSRGVSFWVGVSVQGSLCSGGVSVQRSLCLGGLCLGVTFPGVSVEGGSVWGSLSMGISVMETPQCVGSTHPAGMHSCLNLKIFEAQFRFTI